MSSLFEHVVEQYPDNLRREKYQYWSRLKRAYTDFERSPEYPGKQPDQEGFVDWLEDKYGLRIELSQGMWTPYYTVTDSRKFLLFSLAYS